MRHMNEHTSHPASGVDALKLSESRNPPLKKHIDLLSFVDVEREERPEGAPKILVPVDISGPWQ
jgi:hypothetical protein